MKNILIVDDDVAVTNYLLVFLMQTDLFEPTIINDSREVVALLETESFDVILLDLDMPNVSGMDILRIMNSKGIKIPVIILTGASDVELAVRAMKHKAFDYLTKPVDDDHLLEVINSALEQGALHDSMDQLAEELTHEDLDNTDAFKHLPTSDPTVIRLFHQAETLAKGDLGVFIWGERGCGKRWLAKAIHNASDRADKPFVALDCTSFASDELSCAIFGRAEDWSGKQGEMTGFLKTATHGTLFINNIEHLSLPVQIRLNTTLQSGEYYRDNSTETQLCDVRFIVASSNDLKGPEFKESFSRDLLYHVMINSIRIPPLRDRRDDIPLISQQFFNEERERSGKKLTGICPDYLDLLQQYSFPGNLQELKKLILSSYNNTIDGELTINSLSSYSRERLTLDAFSSKFTPRRLHDVIVDHITHTLAYYDGDRLEAAKQLGVSEDELRLYLD